MAEKESIKRLILQKLVRSNMRGGKHTPVDFVLNGIPVHCRNTHKGHKAIDEALKQLMNEEWVILTVKKTGRGSDSHISLNPRKVSEIKRFLEGMQL